MRKIALFLLFATFSLNISNGKAREEYVVLRWSKQGLKIYELAERDDAMFVVEESKLRGEKALLFRGNVERVYLSCAMGYFLQESHPRIDVKLLMSDIRKKCNKCKPVNCEIGREEALDFLERGGAKDIAQDMKDAYRRIGQ